MQPQALRERMTGQGCDVQRVRFREQAAFEKCFHLQQSFDQSLMNWFNKGVVTYDDALFAASNPAEFALKAQGIGSASDTSWDTVKQEVT